MIIGLSLRKLEARVEMSAQTFMRKVREQLVTWGLVSRPRPRFYLRRQEVGSVRGRLTGRGSAKRMRHVSLRRLLGQ